MCTGSFLSLPLAQVGDAVGAAWPGTLMSPCGAPRVPEAPAHPELVPSVSLADEQQTIAFVFVCLFFISHFRFALVHVCRTYGFPSSCRVAAGTEHISVLFTSPSTPRHHHLPLLIPFPCTKAPSLYFVLSVFYFARYLYLGFS